MAGLTASAGLAGWVEFTLLRRSLTARVGSTGVPARLVASLWGAAVVAAAAAYGAERLLAIPQPILRAAVVLPLYGLLYLGFTAAMGIAEAGELMRAVRRRFGGAPA
jgi:putative peptidoglycan lipid II flippase